MPRKFLWMTLPPRAPEGEGGAPAPTPGAAASEAAPPPASSEGQMEGVGDTLLDGAKPPAEAAKPDDAGSEAAPPPIDLEKLALPEGMARDSADLKAAHDILLDKDLSPQARLEKLASHGAEMVQKAAQSAAAVLAKDYSDLNAKWQSEVKADPEIGGAKLSETMATIAGAIDTYGDGPEVRKALNLTGAGNNPHIIRMLHKMSLALKEGGPAQGGVARPTKSMTEIFYPSKTAEPAAS